MYRWVLKTVMEILTGVALGFAIFSLDWQQIIANAKQYEQNYKYFQILGINPWATPQEVKRAFRILAHKYHPDKNKYPGAEDKFMEINEAKEVLMKLRGFSYLDVVAYQVVNTLLNFFEKVREFGSHFGGGGGQSNRQRARDRSRCQTKRVGTFLIWVVTNTQCS